MDQSQAQADPSSRRASARWTRAQAVAFRPHDWPALVSSALSRPWTGRGSAKGRLAGDEPWSATGG